MNKTQLLLWLLTYHDLVSTNEDFNLTETQEKLNKLCWYKNQSDSIKQAIIGMVFVMGYKKVLSLISFVNYISKSDYTNAALEFLKCAWSKKVGHRANDIATLISENKIF